MIACTAFIGRFSDYPSERSRTMAGVYQILMLFRRPTVIAGCMVAIQFAVVSMSLKALRDVRLNA